jgi:glycosyltransferase involved in cell wall biosynthesis
MGKIKLLCVVPDTYGTGYFRMLRPHQHLMSKYGNEFNVTICYHKDFKYTLIDLEQFNIITFSKTILINNILTLENINLLKLKGVKFVMDLDDYWEVNKTHPSYFNFKLHKYKDMVFNNFTIADYVTCTTNVFAKEIKKYHKNVIVLPNAIDFNELQWSAKNVESSGRVRVMWCGGSSHLNDIEELKYLVNKVKNSDLKDKIQFVLCGFNLTNVDTKDSSWIKYEKIFTENYTLVSDTYKNYLLKYDLNLPYDGIENEPYVRMASTNINNYGKFYTLADICLAPLENIKLNEMKSQLKIVEAGAYSKPIICSNISAYNKDITNVYQRGGNYNIENGNGFIANNKQDFYKFIKYLVDNPINRVKIGENLNKLIFEKFNLDVVTDDRYQFYLKLLKF